LGPTTVFIDGRHRRGQMGPDGARERPQAAEPEIQKIWSAGQAAETQTQADWPGSQAIRPSAPEKTSGPAAENLRKTCRNAKDDAN
jgi:hypothetical protein